MNINRDSYFQTGAVDFFVEIILKLRFYLSQIETIDSSQ